MSCSGSKMIGSSTSKGSEMDILVGCFYYNHKLGISQTEEMVVEISNNGNKFRNICDNKIK